MKRLKTDYLDVLLLHRPDALMEPEEVAEAFDLLESSGKVRYFGVSNDNPMQIQLLKKSVKQPIVANQLQLSIAHATMISSGHQREHGKRRRREPGRQRAGFLPSARYYHSTMVALTVRFL